MAISQGIPAEAGRSKKQTSEEKNNSEKKKKKGYFSEDFGGRQSHQCLDFGLPDTRTMNKDILIV